MIPEWIKSPENAAGELRKKLQFWRRALALNGSSISRGAESWEKEIEIAPETNVRLGYAVLQRHIASIRYADLLAAICVTYPRSRLSEEKRQLDAQAELKADDFPILSSFATNLIDVEYSIFEIDDAISAFHQSRVLATLDSTMALQLAEAVCNAIEKMSRALRSEALNYLDDYIVSEGILVSLSEFHENSNCERYRGIISMVREITGRHEMKNHFYDEVVNDRDVMDSNRQHREAFESVLGRLCDQISDMDWDAVCRVYEYPEENYGGYYHRVNVIPGRSPGSSCEPIVVVLAHHKAHPLKKALENLTSHLVKCPNSVSVIVLTDSWNEKDLSAWKGSERGFKDRGGSVVYGVVNSRRAVRVHPL
jgi:hypothetical protein